MNTELIGIITTFIVTILISYPLGKYISKVFKGEKVFTDFLAPLENLIVRISGIDRSKKMGWKENMKGMILLNFIFFLWGFAVLLLQGYIPFWNPSGFSGWEPMLAFNTAISFVTNTNLQHYSGETTASYFSQLAVFSFLQFVSAGTGIAGLALLFKGLVQKQSDDLGNFYLLFIKSCTRILLPISFFVAIVLLLNGVPQTFDAPSSTVTLEGDTVTVASGPVASFIAIKHTGTNGGGFFGVNSAHPFESPNYLTNMLVVISELIIAMGLVFSFGFYTGKRRFSLVIFSVMTILFLIFAVITTSQEMSGNPVYSSLGVDNSAGNTEGKETRFGAAASGYFGVVTTSTSTGAVNSMHDSFMPISGGIFLIDMMVNAIYGGVGVGFMNFFIYLIVAVFIAGLMVGRTPEFMGKKIEAREIKIAAIITILHPLLILTATAFSSHIAGSDKNINWLSNPSFHGFSQMLYEFTSASANNGSGFEGLGDNNGFWNISTGIIMLIGRFIPIIGSVAIAGFLAEKKFIPESEGTLKLDNLTFGLVLIAVIVIIAVLSFFPSLALGPIAEHLSIGS